MITAAARPTFPVDLLFDAITKPRARTRITRRSVALLLLLALTTVAGCTIADRRDGVSNRWRALPKDTFTEGRTTRRDVLTRLGPPSRIMALRGRTVFYYLLEDSHLVGLNLVIYNQSDTVVRYDRAVFFFDSDDRLESWALSDEVIRDDD